MELSSLPSTLKSMLAAGPLVDWVQAEAVFSTNPQRGTLFELAMPAHLVHRRIYYYEEVIISDPAADYFLDCNILFRLSGSQVGNIPLVIAKDDSNTLLTSGKVSLAYNITPHPNQAGLCLGNKFTAGRGNVSISPLLLPVYCDKMQMICNGWNVKSPATFTGFRMWLGVMSTL